MATKELAPSLNTHNILTTGTVIEGNILTEGDFRIDGSIQGNIVCKGKIIIGQNGIITGNIECTNIELMGTVNGNVQCAENIILRNSSALTGDIKTQTIEIEAGAKFSGKCAMLINQ